MCIRDRPQWVPLVLLGCLGFASHLRKPVDVFRGRMEWPKCGAGLALLCTAGWVLASNGGEPTGLNGVSAVRGILDALAGGPLGLSPSLAAGAGIAAFGLASALSRGRSQTERGVPARDTARLAAAAFALGLAGSLAGGCPAAHALFGSGILGPASVVFVFAMVFGSWIAGLWKRAEPGEPAAPEMELSLIHISEPTRPY